MVRSILLFVGISTVTVGTSVGTIGVQSPPAQVRPLASRAQPWVGILQAQPGDYSLFVKAGVRRVALELGWDAYEPSEGVVNSDYVAAQRLKVAMLKASGVEVVLDPGLQYPPAWVFGLPGETRFVDQYGDIWRSGTGSNVANAVFDPAVRDAEVEYLQQVRLDFGPAAFTAVRVGGLTTGELHYPARQIAGKIDPLWFYDSAAQARAPVPGWKPGRGTAEEAWQSMDYYYDSLVGYEKFLLSQVSKEFPGAELEVLLPGWGIRPGQTANAIDEHFSGKSTAESGGSLSEGTDYPRLVAAIAKFKAKGVVYDTWIDASSRGTSTSTEAPILYLAALAKKYGLQVAGESTGSDTTAALDLTFSRLKSLHLAGMMWMSASGVLSASGVTITSFGEAIEQTRGWK